MSTSEGVYNAKIALLGNYINSTFVAPGEGHGGASITEQPASQQALLAQPHAA
jgi:hypothetical protein